MWWWKFALGAPVSPVSASVPATGRHEAVFTVPEFGRYAVTATSSQGTAVSVLDRMAGILGTSGAAGHRDGRVDLFLDRGQIKVLADADPSGTGAAELRVTGFTTPEPPLRLEPERRVETTLTDLQSRGWWIDLPTGGAVSLDASGRYLADLRLWRDGVWLVDAAPSCALLEPTAATPWRRCSVSANLEPGVYLAGVYGGPGAPWTTDAPDAPLHVQWGVPRLPSGGQKVAVLPASGYVRWTLPDGVDTVHVALPDVAPFRLAQPGSASVAEITTESRRPAVQAHLEGEGDRTVTLSGLPGQPYTFTWFRAATRASAPGPGTYWVGSITTADPADVLAFTGLVTRPIPQTDRVERTATQALPASSTSAVSARFNLAAETRALVEVTEDGPYVFWVEGTGARLQVEPYLTVRPKGMAEPELATGELHVDLVAGLYSLRLLPDAPGVATLGIGYDSLAARALRTLGTGPAPVVLRPTFQVPSIALDASSSVSALVPRGVPAGVFVRALPLDPVDALPVSLLPSEVLDVPLRVSDRGTLTFQAPDGTSLPLRLDGGAMATELAVGPGDHVVRLVNPATAVRTASLQLVPDRDRADAPLPSLSPERLATLDAFPRLKSGKPVGVDLVDGVSKTVRLVVDQPALYVVESTGLLATTGAVRTRTLPSLVEASTNGAGRNFQIARFLRAGDYQLTATALEPSAGHAGLQLRTGVIEDGGEIRDGTPARVTLGPDEAVRHTVVIAKSARYAIRHEGRTRPFDCRLEDPDGWTVTGVPDQTCDLQLWLDAGTYVLVGLPDRVESRRVTTVREVDDAPVTRTGHGPFPLALQETAEAVWVEPKGDGERPWDLWELTVPADLHATISLSPEMAGEVRVGGATTARLVPGEPWSGGLARGTAQVAVRGARRGTGVPYTLRVDARELVAGSTRTLGSDGAVDVVVAEPGVYTLESDGGADVRARLTDADGHVVASNDDRPDDWNFRISTRLDPGTYRLTLDEVAPAADGGELSVSMRAPRELDGGELESDVARTVKPGHDALLLNLAKSRPEVVVATATSNENVGVALEVKTADGWRGVSVGTGRSAVAVARVDDRPIRVRVWSEDGRGGDVKVVAHNFRTRDVADGGLSGGVSLGKEWGAVKASGGAGQFALAGDPAGVWVCGLPGAACAPAREGLLSAPEEGLVLVRDGGTLAAERVRLAHGETAALRVGRPTERLQLEGSGPVVVELRAATGSLGARIVDTTAPVLVSGHAALAVGVDGGGAVELWGQGHDEADVKAVAHRLDPIREEPGGDGVHAFVVPANGAVSVPVREARNVLVDLEAGLAVLTGDGRGAWAEPATTAVHLRAALGPLVIVNPTTTERLVRVELLAASGGSALVEGGPHEGVHAAAETWVMPVPASEGMLHVRGHAQPTFVRADGAVSDTGPFVIGAGGVLTLAVTPGPVLAWVETAGAAGPVRSVSGATPQTVTGAATVRLQGDAATLSLRPPVPSALALRAPCPLVARIDVPGGWSRVEVLDTGARADVWIPDPATGASVALRALAGAALFGELAVAPSVPVVLGEGLGPETLLPPGGAAWFSLTVTRDGLLGFGARATAERVDAVLMDPTGRELGRGVVLSRTLAPGPYLLALSQPVGSAPVRARPVVVGLAAPPEGPPEDVVRTYLPFAPKAEPRP